MCVCVCVCVSVCVCVCLCVCVHKNTVNNQLTSQSVAHLINSDTEPTVTDNGEEKAISSNLLSINGGREQRKCVGKA